MQEGTCGRNIHHPAQWPYGAAHWQVEEKKQNPRYSYGQGYAFQS